MEPIVDRRWKNIPWQIKAPWLLIVTAGLLAISATNFPIYFAEGPDIFWEAGRLHDLLGLLFTIGVLGLTFFIWWLFLWHKKRLARTTLLLTYGAYFLYRIILDYQSQTLSNYLVYQAIIFGSCLCFFTAKANQWFSRAWEFRERPPRRLVAGCWMLVFYSALIWAIPWIDHESKTISVAFTPEFINLTYSSFMIGLFGLIWTIAILRGSKVARILVYVWGTISSFWVLLGCLFLLRGMAEGKPRFGLNILTMMIFFLFTPGTVGLWIITRKKVVAWFKEKAPLNFIDAPYRFSWL